VIGVSSSKVAMVDFFLIVFSFRMHAQRFEPLLAV
jgi:hypothetical protein